MTTRAGMSTVRPTDTKPTYADASSVLFASLPKYDKRFTHLLHPLCALNRGESR